MVWMVVYICLMMFWLFGGGYYAHNQPNGPFVFCSGTLIPWAAVLILGLVVFGAVSTGPSPLGR